MNCAPQLLGDGLDAIVQRATPRRSLWARLLGWKAGRDSRLCVAPDDQQRRDRYYRAAGMHAHASIEAQLLRAKLGFEFREAWKRGMRINFVRIRTQLPDASDMQVTA